MPARGPQADVCSSTHALTGATRARGQPCHPFCTLRCVHTQVRAHSDRSRASAHSVCTAGDQLSFLLTLGSQKSVSGQKLILPPKSTNHWGAMTPPQGRALERKSPTPPSHAENCVCVCARKLLGLVCLLASQKICMFFQTGKLILCLSVSLSRVSLSLSLCLTHALRHSGGGPLFAP